MSGVPNLHIEVGITLKTLYSSRSIVTFSKIKLFPLYNLKFIKIVLSLNLC